MFKPKPEQSSDALYEAAFFLLDANASLAKQVFALADQLGFEWTEKKAGWTKKKEVNKK